MGRSWRKRTVSGVSAAAVLLGLASAAFACTYNMQGTIWFTGTAGGSTVTSGRAGATVYSQASGLYSAASLYEIRYVPLANDGVCHDSPLVLGPRTFATDSSGAWTNEAVALPSVRGTYAFCAATVAATSAADQPAARPLVNWSTSHITFTVI